jgi:hypothetical protein
VTGALIFLESASKRKIGARGEAVSELAFVGGV